MPRHVWVSNIPTPYKARLIAATRTSIEIDDHYLAATEPGRHWHTQGHVLRTCKFPLGEAYAYALTTRAPRLEGTAGIMLPGWENPASWQLLRRARRAGVPTVAFYESTLNTHAHHTGPVAWIRSRFFNSVDAMLTAGPAATAALLAMGVPADRIVTGFNSVDVEAFSTAASNARRHVPVHTGHHFLYVGQLIRRKGIQLALQAFADVAGASDHFRIVGDGPLRTSLEALVRELGLADAVEFTGHLEGNALFEAFATSDTLVLPSREEVWGFVVNEALASGLHVVVSEPAGVVASVRHMPGVYVARPTREDLAQGLAESRAAWKGTIKEPEMLQHTPERAAQFVLGAFSVARATMHANSGKGGPVGTLWLTNIVTPYRAALWHALDGRMPLVVACLARSEANRSWDLDADSTLDVRQLDARSYSGRPLRTPLYAPSLRLARLIRRTRPDVLVVDGWESPAFMQASLLARARGSAIIASYRSTELTHTFQRGPVAFARRRFFQRADAVFTAGPASTAAVLAMGVEPARVVTGFNAVDVLAFDREATRVRAETPVSPGHTYLFVGQLIERKNLRDALRAFHSIAGEHDRFQVAGSGPDRPDLERLIAELGLSAQVAFLGDQHGVSLHQAYGTSHTLVLPSTEEVWGLVVNEALASGLHVVVSSRAGIVPSVSDMQGVFVAEPTAASLAEQMTMSRDQWDGPIANPEMLGHTPEDTATAVLKAIEIAQASRAARTARR